MVWNAINDPLFGYLQDNSRVPCCSQRRLSILYGAPLYSLAFLIAWFPWQTYAPGDWLSGVHLTVSLCAFDAMLTFVLLAQCALFAEISGHHQSRIRLVKYNQVRTLHNTFSIGEKVHASHTSLIPSYTFYFPGGFSHWFLKCPLLWCSFQKHGGLCILPSLLSADRYPELWLHALHRLQQRESLRPSIRFRGIC